MKTDHTKTLSDAEKYICVRALSPGASEEPDALAFSLWRNPDLLSYSNSLESAIKQARSESSNVVVILGRNDFNAEIDNFFGSLLERDKEYWAERADEVMENATWIGPEASEAFLEEMLHAPD